MLVVKNGEKTQMNYEEVCKELGITAGIQFVKITNVGTIGFTCGKPDEICYLLKQCERMGYKASQKLINTVKNRC